MSESTKAAAGAPVGETTYLAEEGQLIIASPSGKGQKQIPASQWPRYASSGREWVILNSNVTGAHHSDNAF